MSNTGQAWVTLATNDSYALGALVLAQSLKRNNTIHQLAVLITPGVSPAMREALSSTFDLVKEVDVLDSKDAANLALLARPDLGITFTKLHCWNLIQYTKCVFLDADTLVVKNCDELFERDELSAAPDAGWPDCFNSGVFVFIPSETTFKALLDFALSSGSFDGGDQGLLNMYFGDWATKDITKHLPFIYNMVASATYSYLPAFKAFGGNVKIAHFIGSSKPWLQALPSGTTLSSFLDIWWDIFLKDVSKNLNTNMEGLAGALAGGQKDIIEDQWRKQSWEQGNIDYMGKDAFENIWKKISETVGEEIKPLEAPVLEVIIAQEESAPAPTLEVLKTETKTDSSEVDSEIEALQPQSESPKAEATPETTAVAESVVPPKPEATAVAEPVVPPKPEATAVAESVVPPKPETTAVAEPVVPPKPETPQATEAKKEEASKLEASGPSAPQAEAAAVPQVPDVEPKDKPQISAVPVGAPLEAKASPVEVTEPSEPAEVIPSVQQPSAPAEPAPAATTETAAEEPAPTPEPTTQPEPAVQPPCPPSPTAEVPSSPKPPQPVPKKVPKTSTPPPADKKGPSLPKDDSKPPETPKEEGAEKVVEAVQDPAAPTPPSVPSPASPSAPEGTKVDAAQSPISPEPQTPSPAETSSPPQTPTGDAPVPPKRSSKKGKAKK